MNERKILSYIPYMRIINLKNQVRIKLNYFLDLEDKLIDVSSEELALFSTIDYDNLNKNTIDMNSTLLKGIKDYLNDEENFYELNKEQIKELLEIDMNGRINPKINKEIALKFAHNFNDINTVKAFTIDYELINKICDSIK